ncbi:MAG: hypothetical protein K2M37_05630 [Muribaculaceae bacterium]|nr:hypothetical protein [Muribaculaceae bacterium]
MIPKLTHTEACRMVEDAIERVGKTLAYIRLRLAENPNYMSCSGSEIKVKASVNEANLLCNINYYGAYLQGAQRMALALQEWDMLDTPLKKIGSGNYKGTKKREPKPVIQAIFDLFLENTRNLDWCLHGLPDNVEIVTQDVLNNKGKVTGVKAKFVKKETKYKEI